jgi:hypothetical protein
VITGNGEILEELVIAKSLIVGNDSYTFYVDNKVKHYPVNRTIIEEL